MELNTNGVSARLYRWFYVTDRMPESLCPYFWKLVIAYTFLVPFAILNFPIFLFMPQDSVENTTQRLFAGAFLWVVLLLAIEMVVGPISAIFTGFLHDGSFLAHIQAGGFLTLFVVIVISLVSGIIYLIQLRKDKRRRKQLEYIWNDEGDFVPNPDYVPHVKKPNIIVEFIKATYNKYCPKIDWK